MREFAAFLIGPSTRAIFNIAAETSDRDASKIRDFA